MKIGECSEINAIEVFERMKMKKNKRAKALKINIANIKGVSLFMP